MEQEINKLLESLIPITDKVVGELVSAVGSNDDEKAEVVFKQLLDIKVVLQQLNVINRPNDLKKNNNYQTLKGLLLLSAKEILLDSPNNVGWANRILDIVRKLTYNVGD
jgi:hypothetical protein